MAALGGRANWDATRYITWRFFGFRLHVWDKWTRDIRFEQGDLTVLMNIHSRKGRAFAAGVEISDPDTVTARLEQGYRAWINDSYRGPEATEDGRPPKSWSSPSGTSGSPRRTNTRSGSIGNRGW